MRRIDITSNYYKVCFRELIDCDVFLRLLTLEVTKS